MGSPTRAGVYLRTPSVLALCFGGRGLRRLGREPRDF